MGTLVTGPVETRFYSRVRPTLEIQAPECHHGAVDPLRGSTILLLEDIARTRGAEFHEAGSPDHPPGGRGCHEDAGRPARAVPRARRPDFLRSYPAFWKRAIRLVRIDHYYRRCLREATDYLPAEIHSRPAETWSAFLCSVELHHTLPRTVIHNDPHAGNWYSTADGQPGLADWGAVTTGHWSRDLAYALSTMLTIDDRRLWERELVELYTEELGALSGQAIDPEDAWLRYRQQVWGALAFWAPTFSPPRLVPGDMQPREVAAEMLTRIGTALIDLDSSRCDRGADGVTATRDRARRPDGPARPARDRRRAADRPRSVRLAPAASPASTATSPACRVPGDGYGAGQPSRPRQARDQHQPRHLPQAGAALGHHLSRRRRASAAWPTGRTGSAVRKMLNPKFTASGLAPLGELIVDAITDTIDGWEQRAGTGEPFDIQEEFSLLTMAVMLRSMFTRPAPREEVERLAGQLRGPDARHGGRRCSRRRCPRWVPRPFERRSDGAQGRDQRLHRRDGRRAPPQPDRGRGPAEHGARRASSRTARRWTTSTSAAS